MNLDLQQIGMALLGGGMGCLGWFGRALWSAVQQLKTDISKLEVNMNRDYIRYDRLQDSLKPIMSTLERIEKVLAHKVDKP